ncbi:MAG TPA: TolC family outer membrane protein, partial [Rhizobacter sp.]|nr:TolC family outer membrane protein [Rhizobacter sp.]
MSAVSMSCLPRLSRLALACALSLGAVSFAQAENLQEVYDMARGYDATYLAAKAQAESNQYRADQVHALRRPSVGLTVGASRIGDERPAQDSTTTASSARIDLNQSIFNRANDAAISQADLLVDVGAADLQAAEQDLIVRVSQAYFDVLNAQDSLAAEQANLAAISVQLASAKRNFEVGTATITDTREAQARYDLATAQVLVAENNLQTRRVALDQLVGRSGVTPKPLVVPVALPPLPSDTVEEFVQRANDSPPVRRARLGYESAQLETTKARAGHLPTVGLTAGYGKGDAKIASNQGNFSGGTTASTVGINLNLPLFAGFSVQNRIKETLLLEDQSRNNLEFARRTAEQQTRVAYLFSRSLQAQMKALEAAEASSQLALESTQLGYKVGVRVNLDVLNAQTQLTNAQRDVAKSRYDTLLALLRLRQAAGQLN